MNELKDHEAWTIVGIRAEEKMKSRRMTHRYADWYLRHDPSVKEFDEAWLAFAPTEGDPFVVLTTRGASAERAFEEATSLAWYDRDALTTRMVVKGDLRVPGGKYPVVDPETGERHMVEVRDSGFFPFSDQMDLKEIPIADGQEFLEILMSPEEAEASEEAPEIAENREGAPEGRRQYEGAENVRVDGAEGPEDAEAKDEVEEPAKIPETAREKLDRLRGFLGTVRQRLDRKHDSLGKLALALCDLGNDDAYLRGLRDEWVVFRVDKGTLRGRSRMKKEETVDRALRMMEEGEALRKFRVEGDLTNHYSLNVDRMMTSASLWGLSEDDLRRLMHEGGVAPSPGDPVYASGGDIKYKEIPSVSSRKNGEVEEVVDTIPYPPSEHKSFPSFRREEEVRKILVNTFHLGMGDAPVRYTLALVNLGGEATNARIAEAVGVKNTSTARVLAELEEAGVIRRVSRGVYALAEDFLERFGHLRVEKGEEIMERENVARIVAEKRENGYALRLAEAVGRGKDPRSVPVPKGLPEPTARKVLARAMGAFDRKYNLFDDLMRFIAGQKEGPRGR